ncbi:hypothetical protein N9112_00065 [bacterium]|nr:hypothetical protein [bacterium]
MAKITAKASLVQDSNLFLHIADKGANDITFDDVDGTEFTLTTLGATDWTNTAAADVNGVINRGIEIGDEITLSHMGTAANEGIIGTVTGVTSLVVTADKTSAHTMVDEASGSDINIIATKKTYQFTEVGALSFVDGVQGIVLASKLVDMWDSLDLDKYDRPFTSIEPRAKSVASINGWEPHDQDTIDAIRDTALEIRATLTATASKIYALWRSGTSHDSGDQFKFWPSSDAELTAPTNAVMTGYMNQLFLIYDVAGADNRFSNGVTWFTRCAEPLKTIVMEEHNVDYAEIMPVSAANSIDPKLTVSDASGAPYSDVTFTNDTAAYSGDVDGANYDFDYLLDGSDETNEVVHNRINWMLRQTTDINAGDGGTMRGDKQWPITSFTGDIFTVQGYLLNYKASQRNNLRVVDTGPVIRSWPQSMTLTITAPTIVQGGAMSIYHANTYGTNDAVLFQNEGAVEQKDVAIASSVSIVMAYSTYAVDGHTGGNALDVKIAYNKPGSVEPDVIDATLEGNNLTVAISPSADPSYLA